MIYIPTNRFCHTDRQRETSREMTQLTNCCKVNKPMSERQYCPNKYTIPALAQRLPADYLLRTVRKVCVSVYKIWKLQMYFFK